MSDIKTVLITGSSSGIGRAAVVAFAEAGWNVAATMRTPEPGAFADYARVKTFRLDVTDPASITQAFRGAQSDFGTVNVVVNNAGYAVDGVFEAMDDTVIQKQFDANVFGLMRVTREAIMHMRGSGGGVIVQVSSMGGRLAFPLYSIYHASKWAVEGFSESLQYELDPFNIRIKIIEPGVITTAFYGSSRRLVRPPSDMSYHKFVDRVERVSRRAAARGEDPAKVAATIVRAASDTSQRLRYIVGKPAPMLLMLRRMVPERLFRALIRRGYSI